MPGPRVDVWVDPLCPFCYVALERVAWLRERWQAEIHWHPFDLHPEYPPEGIPRDVLRARLPGADEYTVRMFEENALPFGGIQEHIPNSRNAQRVAIEAGGGLLPAFSRAYWGEGLDIGDDEVIVEVARREGLDEDAVRGVLASDAHLDTLLAETQLAHEAGATGVPAWIFDEKALVPGAQPHEVFEHVLGRLGHA